LLLQQLAAQQQQQTNNGCCNNNTAFRPVACNSNPSTTPFPLHTAVPQSPVNFRFEQTGTGTAKRGVDFTRVDVISTIR